MKLAILALLPLAAYAACPNACSGHGSCGEHDMCTCHTNWIGGDCSERQCMYGWSWITTAKGDLNFDGDRNDATIYDDDNYYTDTAVNYLNTQQNKGGDWEYWPSIFSSGNDEGHFYMECSNRGICNRKSGECECFEGYTGEACRRTDCPDGCNGHGRCQTVSEQKGGNTYNLWDADMSRSCVCDAGYSGPSCASRKCPIGDDPLTTDQQMETQHIDISLSTNEAFGGSVTFTYTDPFGKAWTTGDVSVAAYAGSSTGTATAAATALNDLPNDVLSGVTVTEAYCDQAIKGTGKFTATTFAAGTTNGFGRTMATNDAFRCSGSNTGTFSYAADPLKDAAGADVSGLTAEDDVSCFLLTSVNCIRLAVTFHGNTATARGGSTGDIPALALDTGKVSQTSNGELDNNALNGFTVNVAVTDSLTIGENVATNGVTVKYTAADSVKKVCASGDACSVTASSKIVALDAGGDSFGTSTSERIKVYCGASLLLGTYTVASATATAITVTESIPDCTSGSLIEVHRVTDILEVNTDVTSLVSAGDYITSSSGNYGISRAVLSTHYTTASGKTYVYLDNDENTANDFATANIAETTAGTDSVVLYSLGTTEGSECSDRGVCDSASGLCRCFKGYTGYACNLQNALNA